MVGGGGGVAGGGVAGGGGGVGEGEREGGREGGGERQFLEGVATKTYIVTNTFIQLCIGV